MTTSKALASRRGSMLKVLMPVLILSAAAYGGYQFFSAQKPKPPAPVAISADMLKKSSDSTVVVTDTKIMEGHVSVILDGLSVAIAAIKDEDGVQPVSAALADAIEQWDSLHAPRWPESAKSALKPMLSNYVSQLETACEAAYQIPGVQDDIEPAAGSLLKKIRSGLPTP